MLSNELRQLAEPKVKTQVIIFLALAMGMLTFVGFVAFLVDWKKLSTEASMMALMGAITGLMTYAMSFVLPKLLSAQPADLAASLVKQTNLTDVPASQILDKLISNSMSSKIISGALMEGGVFLNLLVFFIEPNTVSMAIVGIGLVIFALRFPFPFRQFTKLERELDGVQRELRLLKK